MCYIAPDLRKALTALDRELGGLLASAETVKLLVMMRGRKVRTFVKSELVDSRSKDRDLACHSLNGHPQVIDHI